MPWSAMTMAAPNAIGQLNLNVRFEGL